MGSAASSDVTEALSKATAEEIQSAARALSAEQRAKLKEAITNAEKMALPLPCMTLIDVAEMLRCGAITSEVLTRAVLERIEKLDPRLHAYACITKESALEEARKADAEIKAEGTTKGPLHGVPIAVKDLFGVKGVQNAAGTKALLDKGPCPEDCEVVARLRKAGAVFLGKLNTTEAMFGTYSEKLSLDYVPLNPWNTKCWPGNSSSGSGVAAAAGLAYLALGSDTGGSVRYPAAMNGCFALKPTFGRCSVSGCIGLSPTLDHVGILSRCAADAAIALQIMAGPDPNDPLCLTNAPPNMFEQNGRDFKLLLDLPEKPLQIGVDESFNGDNGGNVPTDPELQDCVKNATEALAEAIGATIVAYEMPEPKMVEGAMFGGTVKYEACRVHRKLGTWPDNKADYGADFADVLESGDTKTNEEYDERQEARKDFRDRINAVMDEKGLDVLAMPAHHQPATELDPDQPRAANDAIKSIRYTARWNLTGHPTITIPCGMSKAGLPLAFQLVGKHLSEELLCKLGHKYEEAVRGSGLPPLPEL